MKDLHLGRGVTWPAALASQAIAELGMRGAGKSNAGRVYAEELFNAGIPFVVFDPVGGWVGIRSGRDGRAGGGLPVPIFGGAHGDLPLDRSSGPRIADLVIDRQLSCVLDLSHEDFSETDKQVFLAAFGERLYRRKKRETGWLALILEEADDYAPQPRSGGGVKGPAAATLGVFQRLVRRGRSRGLGALMITQRSAAINKDLLYMVGTLVAFRTTGPRDQEAIDGWLKYNQPEIRERVMGSLARLEDGEAWVIAQEALGSIERVKFRRMTTYDTGSTPEHGGQAKPATLADIDVPALSKELAAAAEKRKAEDPEELRRQLAEMRAAYQPLAADLAPGGGPKEVRAALHRLMTAKPPPAAKAPRDVPVLKAEHVKRLETAVERLLAGMASMGDRLAQRQQVVVTEAGTLRTEIRAALAATRDAHGNARGAVAGSALMPAAVGAGRPAAQSRPAPVVSRERSSGGRVGDGRQRLLSALAVRDRPLSRFELGVFAVMSSGGGTFRTYLPQLLREGLITEDQQHRLYLTAEGGKAADATVAPAPGAPLREAWARQLSSGGMQRLFDVLVAAYPQGLTRAELGEKAEMSHTGGTFRTYFPKLSRLGLVEDDRGQVRAVKELFEE